MSEDKWHRNHGIDQVQRHNFRHKRWYKILTLLSYIALYGGVGCIMGLLGPALPGLAKQVGLRDDDNDNSASSSNSSSGGGSNGGAGFGEMGFAFTARGSGWLIGSVVGGVMLDRHQAYGHWLIGSMVAATGLFTALLGLCRNLLEMLLTFLCQGLAAGSAEAMVNTLVVWLFSKKATAPLQSIHFGFGMGAFLAPILVAGSLHAEDTIEYSFYVIGVYCAIAGMTAFLVPCPHSDRSQKEKQKTAQVTSSTPQVPTYTRFEDPNSRIQSRSYDPDVNMEGLSQPSKSDESGFIYRERFRESYGGGTMDEEKVRVPNTPEEEQEKTRLLRKEDPDYDYGSMGSSSSSSLRNSMEFYSHPYSNDDISNDHNNYPHIRSHTDDMNITDEDNDNVNLLSHDYHHHHHHHQKQKQKRKSISWAKATFSGRTLSLADVRSYLRRMKVRVTLGSILVALTALYLFLSVGDEVALGGWFSAYAIALNILSEQKAALLSSMFWGALTLGRLIAIPLSAALAPPYMLLIAMTGSSIATALFCGFPTHPVSLWSVTAATGLFLAPVYPSSVAMPGTFGLRITGRATSFLIVGACMGEVTVPFTIAPPFEYLGPLSFRWVTLGVTLAAFTVFGMQWLVGKKILRSYSIDSFAGSLKGSRPNRDVSHEDESKEEVSVKSDAQSSINA